MSTPDFHRLGLTVIAASLVLLSLPLSASGAEATETAVPGTEMTAAPTNATPELAAGNRSLEADLRSARLALEQARQDSEAAARRNDEIMTQRLAAIEQALTRQVEREQTLLLESSRTLFIASVSIGGFGLVMLLLAVWFQVRALNRLAEIAQVHRELMTRALPPPGAGVAALPATNRNEVAAASQRLLDAVGGLDKRMRELERAGPAVPPSPKSNGDSVRSAPASAAGAEEKITALLDRGQTFLSNGQAQQAQECFDQVLALDANHAEGLMKKGAALQAQKKLSEALSCYDQAIASNSALTMAYLYKGGVCNQLERFDEALECYEQAQRLQDLTGAALNRARG